MAAYGTSAAIVSALMGKKAKALDKFRKAVSGKGNEARASDSPRMGALRNRIGDAMRRGEM